MAPVLKTLRETVLKRRPIQASELSEAEKMLVEGGQQFELHSYSFERNHIKFALLNESFKGFNTWYAYAQHVQILAVGGKQSIAYPKPRPNRVKLPVPYKSQLDNWYNPTGACNVTSIAMCLEYLKTPRKTNSGQFEDELYQYALSKGLSRHDPNDLARIVKDYGRRDDFKHNASIDGVKDWLAEGNPAVIHGYFTSFGHIMPVVGYDAEGFIVHDPYGEWFPGGYRTDLGGAFLNYSYGLIRRTCIPDGNFWVHFISR